MTIVEWATAGLKLANENGKTVDDLIVYLKNAEGLSRFFDKLFPQPVSKTDVFGKSEQLADDSRRYAKWNLDGSCSACGKFSLSTYGNFCCFCGAEMKEDEVPESDIPLNNVEG